MTSVYGVTFIGARAQIQKQLLDKNFLNSETDDCFVASVYLAKQTRNCIGDLFINANKIKNWLIKCAQKVVETNNPVSWCSPLGYF